VGVGEVDRGRPRHALFPDSRGSDNDTGKKHPVSWARALVRILVAERRGEGKVHALTVERRIGRATETPVEVLAHDRAYDGVVARAVKNLRFVEWLTLLFHVHLLAKPKQFCYYYEFL